jgi:hypothetical protein
MSAARLEGKVAIITGASRGEGKGVALELAARGASITVNYNNSASAAKAVVEEIEKLGSRAVAIKADVSSFPDIEKLFNEAHKAHFPWWPNRYDVVNFSHHSRPRRPRYLIRKQSSDRSHGPFSPERLLPLKSHSQCGSAGWDRIEYGSGKRMEIYSKWISFDEP